MELNKVAKFFEKVSNKISQHDFELEAEPEEEILVDIGQIVEEAERRGMFLRLAKVNRVFPVPFSLAPGSFATVVSRLSVLGMATDGNRSHVVTLVTCNGQSTGIVVAVRMHYTDCSSGVWRIVARVGRGVADIVKRNSICGEKRIRIVVAGETPALLVMVPLEDGIPLEQRNTLIDALSQDRTIEIEAECAEQKH